jgi:hypothetical protein
MIMEYYSFSLCFYGDDKMAKFLTTRQTTSELEGIIINARNELVLISPYIKIADNLFPSLQQADRKNVSITIVYGKQELDNNVRKQLSQLEHLTLRFLEKLHAKCYYNETKMIISSLNLYDFSENNFEMGILLRAGDDDEAYANAKEHAESLIHTSLDRKAENIFVREPARVYVPVTKLPEPSASGFCIRGGEIIPLDTTHPLCLKHYNVWKEHSDPDYKEKYCHICGQQHKTSFSKPLCLSCFKKSVS